MNVLESLISIVMTDLNEESHARYSGGNATVALFLSDTIPLAGMERVETVRRARWLQNTAPGMYLYVIFYVLNFLI